MMPRPALVLAIAGLVPFVGTALGAYVPLALLEPFGTPHEILLSYGKIILSFMGGCLWGFGTRSDDAMGLSLSISVLPALYAFLLVGDNLFLLALGFALLLVADFWFAMRKLAPDWWISLRIPISAAAILCSLAGALA